MGYELPLILDFGQFASHRESGNEVPEAAMSGTNAVRP
jgi:hypothetical protein